MVPPVPVSYRDLERMLADRGVEVDHVSLFHWVQRFAPELEEAGAAPPAPLPRAVACRRDLRAGRWWWRYLYRAVDGTGQTIDFRLGAKQDKKAAKRFFRQALGRENTRNPRTVVTDRLKSYPGALREMKREGELGRFVRHRRGRWLNNPGRDRPIADSHGPARRSSRRHHVADLDLAVGGDHPVDQELDQGPPAARRRLGPALAAPRQQNSPMELDSPASSFCLSTCASSRLACSSSCRWRRSRSPRRRRYSSSDHHAGE